MKEMIANFLKALLRVVFFVFYRARIKGLENCRAAGKRVLIIANHTSFLDGILLATYLPGDPAFVINPRIARLWWVRWLSLFVSLLPMDTGNPLAIRVLIARLQQNRGVVVFPEGRITVTGELMKIYDGPGLVADRVGAALLPIRIDGAQYSYFSYLRGKTRLRWFPRITMTILPPYRLNVPETLTKAERRERIGRMLSDLMVELIFSTSNTQSTLYEALLKARKIHGMRHIIADDIRHEPISYGGITLRAHVLGRLMAKETNPGEYVGILLPTSTTVAVAFFGLHLYGRIPAMLNFSAGSRGMMSAVATARVETVYTSRRFVIEGKFDDIVARLARKVKVRYLEDLIQEIGMGIKLRGMIAMCFPRLAYGRSCPDVKPDDPAVVLFTSGSEGTPKGVVLSHVNLLSNIEQLKSRGDFNAKDIILNALPTFHSFGFSIGMLFPLMSGIKTFLYPSPLHYRMIPEIAYEINATMMFGTNTFLAGYANHAHPYDFRSLRYVFAGAEKLQDGTREIWMNRFGVRIFEGYGATETAPVLSVNTPMENRPGTVGRFMPGIEYHLEPVGEIEDAGRLWVRGPNVMLGYLLSDAPGELQPLDTDLGPGWYDTGDIVRVDQDGYLRIEGRARRFAKVGGEMVSLTAAEEFAYRAWPDFSHAVVAIADEKKGEQLVLVTECEAIDRQALITQAKNEGFGEIGMPKRVVLTKTVPLLGSGKIDYVAVENLAKE
uniref:Acyl-[acyl-carrier-protein]-phospholipid O-acyltransferase / long-chain-fatty-acid--[acyl-carrier-protein] ligase n=1 Tax=Candidatus Kentrum sp. SD TaxID=2126332 RepID=A0A450Y5U2_9GAMM|nr:MAG: acyl-[acyl-carrier-protein]-phospholipid O-acyltransferase / long-chain-fatty-acid--[acyl-carrier-protein] ligase [Candidatus Kentron sp. SD]VFK40522.1 MAG: acyl-[acyl-carrier-protein]-phospholipid O-acyltransferase / long-chain-fatty-acid--[acyl-carrier-protein] ligase [Candidatus Kentron sp. SD]VFK78369.1 MAG: acyl-[acyl-carrier-protein]-phospholipid O-acyltransferase / long-chain-fatty-acid--[acyl-carrier-protein] ligase [Candidatus Kentron sp. SD]